MQALLTGPRSELTEEQVLSAIGNPSPSVRHGVTVLNADLSEAEETLPVDADTGGQVAWSYRPAAAGSAATATVEVRRRCDLTLAGDVDDSLLLSRLFRVWTELRATDGTWVRFHLGTFTSTLPPRDDDGNVVRRRLTLAPREHLFAARSLADSVTVLAAENVLDHIRDDLSTVFGITSTAFPAPDGATTLGEDHYFKAGTSYAEKWRRMLAGIAYDQVTTNVDGRPTAQPLAVLAGKGPEWTYGPKATETFDRTGRIVVPGTVESLSPELPNVVRFEARNGPSLGATEGNGLYTLTNQSDGPASIDQRGYEVFASVAVEATSQDELESYGNAEVQRLFAGGGQRFTGQVALNPLHDERDVIELVRSRLGLTGVWNVTSWAYPLQRVTGESAALMPITCELRVEAT